MSVTAIILAAGRGRRLGGALPKQYRSLAGLPLLRRTAAAFVWHASVDHVLVVIDPAHELLYDEAVAGLGLLEPVAGGASRQESVLRGLESLTGAAGSTAPDYVLIHDGARPFVSSQVIDRVLAALDGSPGAIPALAVNDTLKRGDGERVLGTVERAGLWRAQTPQGFHFEAILKAHRAALGADLTDDAAVAEAAGLSVATVAGEEDNIKVTTADDLLRAERLIAGAADTRVGSGFDVHRFAEGDHVMLCGVRIAHDAGLAGHSDADCALHAITDAILGALGAGDIGDHFPPGDPQWAGAASDLFLGHAAGLVAARKGRIAHIDVTIICETPRIGPHREAMIARVASILEIAPGRVSVKATTTEGLGFAGRGEGIAAQATATLRMPLSQG